MAPAEQLSQSMTDMIWCNTVKYLLKFLFKRKFKVLPHHYFIGMPNGIFFLFLFFFLNRDMKVLIKNFKWKSLFVVSAKASSSPYLPQVQKSIYKVTGNTENIKLVSSIVISCFLLKNYHKISRSRNYEDRSKQNGHNLREDNTHFVHCNSETPKWTKFLLSEYNQLRPAAKITKQSNCAFTVNYVLSQL